MQPASVQQEQLELEHKKYRQAWWGVLATVASILIAGGAIWFNLRAQSELMGIDMFLNSAESACTYQGQVVSELSDDPEAAKEWRLICRIAAFMPPPRAVQRELAALLMQYPDERSGILAMYRTIYSPKAGWIDKIEQALATGSPILEGE